MTEPLTIIFNPTPTSRRFGLLIGCGFALLGTSFTGVSLGLALLTREDLRLRFLCCGAPFGLFFLLVGLHAAWRAGRATGGGELILDAERLTCGDRSVAIARLASIGARHGFQGRVPFWTVVLADDQAALELEVTQDRYIGTFDVRALLRALLPRVPASCAVEPRVRAFAEGRPLA